MNILDDNGWLIEIDKSNPRKMGILYTKLEDTYEILIYTF